MNLAIITARGGSKGLPGKNTIDLCGVPLIGWTIKAALDSHVFDRVYVSSDCSDILGVSKTLGALPLKRPSHLATDTASSFDTFIHAIDAIETAENMNIHYAGLFQPTSPLRQGRHIKEAYNQLINKKANGILSTYRPSPHPMKALSIDDDGFVKGLYSAEAPYQPRQALPHYCYANGAIYIYKRDSLYMQSNFPEKDILAYEMSMQDSVDIDTYDDLQHVKYLLEARNEKQF